MSDVVVLIPTGRNVAIVEPAGSAPFTTPPERKGYKKSESPYLRVEGASSGRLPFLCSLINAIGIDRRGVPVTLATSAVIWLLSAIGCGLPANAQLTLGSVRKKLLSEYHVSASTRHVDISKKDCRIDTVFRKGGTQRLDGLYNLCKNRMGIAHLAKSTFGGSETDFGRYPEKLLDPRYLTQVATRFPSIIAKLLASSLGTNSDVMPFVDFCVRFRTEVNSMCYAGGAPSRAPPMSEGQRSMFSLVKAFTPEDLGSAELHSIFSVGSAEIGYHLFTGTCVTVAWSLFTSDLHIELVHTERGLASKRPLGAADAVDSNIVFDRKQVGCVYFGHEISFASILKLDRKAVVYADLGLVLADRGGPCHFLLRAALDDRYKSVTLSHKTLSSAHSDPAVRLAVKQVLVNKNIVYWDRLSEVVLHECDETQRHLGFDPREVSRDMFLELTTALAHATQH